MAASADMKICPFCGFPFNPNITYAGHERKRPSGRKKGFCKQSCMTKFFAQQLRHRRAVAKKRALERRWESHGQDPFFPKHVGTRPDAVL